MIVHDELRPRNVVRRPRFWSLALAAACLCPPPAGAQDCLDLVGTLPHGPVAGCSAVKDNHAYFGAGPVFTAVDVSAATNPVVVGEIIMPVPVNDTVVSGDHAYATGWDNLWVFDLAEPASPRLVGSLGLTQAGYLDVSDSYVYVGCS